MWLVYDRFCVCWIEKRIKFTKIPFMVWLFEKNDIPLHSQTKGTLAEWLGNGLQNRVRRFESARYLTIRDAYMRLLFFCLLLYVILTVG